MPTESLTIQIGADASGLQRALDESVRQVTALEDRLARIGSSGSQFDQLGQRISGISNPLNMVSRLLAQVTDQVQNLSRQPVVLNVAPALSSLMQLQGAAGATQARLSSLLSAPAVPAIPTLPFRSPGSNAGMSRFAEGGYVSGPAGVDRVPSWLTAGEFVLRPSAVEQLGVQFLNTLNQISSSAGSRGGTGGGSSVVNHLGGITLNVQRAVEVNDLLRDLRLQGFSLKNRRG